MLRREEIYERVWGYAMAHGDRSVDVFVRKLRQKLRTASPEWNYIHTHFGVGYRFAPELDGGGTHGVRLVGEDDGRSLSSRTALVGDAVAARAGPLRRRRFTASSQPVHA